MFKFAKVSTGHWELNFNDNIAFTIEPYYKDDRYGREKKYFRLHMQVDGSRRDEVLTLVKQFHNADFYFVFDPTGHHYTATPKYFSRMLTDNIAYILSQLHCGDGRVDLFKEAEQVFGFSSYELRTSFRSKLRKMARDEPTRLRELVAEYKRHEIAIKDSRAKYEYDLKKWKTLPASSKEPEIKVFDKLVDGVQRTFSHHVPGSWFRGAFEDAEDATYSSGYDVYDEKPVKVESYKTVNNPRYVRPPKEVDTRYHRDRMAEIRALISK